MVFLYPLIMEEESFNAVRFWKVIHSNDPNYRPWKKSKAQHTVGLQLRKKSKTQVKVPRCQLLIEFHNVEEIE